MSNYVIAIDGPAGAGKSTIARELARQLQFLYIDTGAMYRSIGCYVVSQGIDPEDRGQIVELLPAIQMELRFIDSVQHIFVNGQDLSEEIRTEMASQWASKASAIPEVRAFLLEYQRMFAKNNSVIMDGRDIGTVVLPDAHLKIFLTATPEARARRRFLEQQKKDIAVTYKEVLDGLRQRDYQDTTRSTAPLKLAEDAVLVDTTDLNFQQSVDQIRQLIQEKLGV